jgi:elongation factor Ts
MSQMGSTGILHSLSYFLFVTSPLLILFLAWVVAYLLGISLPSWKTPKQTALVAPVEFPESAKLALIHLVHDETKASRGLCKRALEETDYDLAKAVKLLHITHSRYSGKFLLNGRVHSGVIGDVAVIVEVNCETAFGASQPSFGMFLNDLVMQIAYQNPAMIGRDHIGHAFDPFCSIPPPPPAEEGSILLNQPSIIPDHKGKTVQQLLTELSNRLGEQVVIRRFARYQLGA